MSDNEDSKNVKLVSIKTPVFSETAIRGWFPIMEAQFTLKGITATQTKFYSVLAALPAEVVAKLPASIINAKDYDMLRDSILSTYEKTKPELLDKLMKTTTISGRPSLYLQELATLADRIGASEDIVRHKFLQALPKSISPVIASRKDLSIQQIGKLADELLPFLNNTQIMAVKPPASTNAQTDQTDGRLNQTNNNSTKYGLRPYKPDQKQKICRAHLQM